MKFKVKNKFNNDWLRGMDQDQVFGILKIYLVFVKILGYVDIILLYELYFDVLGDYI